MLKKNLATFQEHADRTEGYIDARLTNRLNIRWANDVNRLIFLLKGQQKQSKIQQNR